MMDNNSLTRRFWRLGLFLFFSLVLVVTHRPATSEWLGRVLHEGRYTHIPLVVFMVAFLMWQRRRYIDNSNQGAWLGLGVMLIAMMLIIVGDLSAIWAFIQYGIVLTLIGAIWVLIGNRIRHYFVPMILLLMTVPLPYMIDVTLSGKMQLLSSQFGVFLLRLLGIVVNLEGNVIDLGVYKLQVVDACSGLNYMFPLMTIGLLFAYIYHSKYWVKLVLFASTVPISILMNSVRIAIVGVLVNYQGISAAEGFMHYFEGWVIFMLCIGMLLAEAKILNILVRESRPVFDLFDLGAPEKIDRGPTGMQINAFPIVAAFLIMALIVYVSLYSDNRSEKPLSRKEFVMFPMSIDGWRGHSFDFLHGENKILHLTDYLQADYIKGQNDILLYIGYTNSQRKGFVPHSPKACIPGGGWEISDTRLQTVQVAPNQTIKVTRLLISQGTNKQIVYYWFRQRGRDLSNEYSMKLALLYDAIRINRTDGAIVRLSTPVIGTIAQTDEELSAFLKDIYPMLPQYVPN